MGRSSSTNGPSHEVASGSAAGAPEGVALELILPGPADPIWTAIPAYLVQALAMPAYQLLHPARGHLASPAGRKLRTALNAAVRGRVTGAHWLVLLTASRTSFGGTTSSRAEQAYTCLEKVVTDYLRPALAEVAATEFAAGLELAASAPVAPTATDASPSAAEAVVPAPAVESPGAPAVPSPEADSLVQAVHDVVEHGAILCVTGLTATTTPAITATSQMQELPTVWVRPHPAKDRSGMVRALYAGLRLEHHRPQPPALNAALELITAELQRRRRLVIVPNAEQLPTAALQLLYGLWSSGGPDRFPLILAGEDGLRTVLERPVLASLNSCVFIRHRVSPVPAAPASAPVSASPAAAAPASPALAVPSAASGPEPAAAASVSVSDVLDVSVPASSPISPVVLPAVASGPAPVVPAAAPADTVSVPAVSVPADTDSTAPAVSGPAAPPVTVPSGPAPATLHEARAALPHLIKTASTGAPSPLTRGTHHAVLTSPPAATVLGWDLTTAEVHGTADARKKLGDLIQAAAEGRPQVLRRHVTPVAVLLPATTAGVPRPPADFTTAPAPAADAPAALAPAAAPDTGPSAPVEQPTAPAAAGPVTAVPGTGATPPSPTGTTPAAAGSPPAPSAPAASVPADVLFAVPDTALTPAGQPAAVPTTTVPGTGVTATAAPAAQLAPGPAAPTAAGVVPPAPASAAAPVQPAPAEGLDTTTVQPGPGPAHTTVPDASAEPAAGVVPLAATPPAPAAAVAARTPRRLAPLAQALDQVLTPTTPPAPEGEPIPATPYSLPTGITSLDEVLGGLQPGRFYLVAAPPGAGGSLLAIAAARTTALDHHLPVLYAASGLTRADVAARIVAAHLPVDYRRLRTGHLTSTEQADATTLHTELAAARLYIDDGTDLTPDAIAEAAADLTHTTTPDGRPGLALIVVDRLQVLDDPRLPLSGPRLTDAAQALAHLARTHHVPVLAILDTDHPDLITTLGLDTTLTLHPHPDAPTTQLLLTIAERDLGTQATLTLTADRTHARLTNPTPFNPYAHPRAPEAPNTAPVPEAPTPAPTAPAPEAPTNPPTTAPEAPTQASAWPTVATPGHPTQDNAAAPQPSPGPDSEVTPATAAALDTLANLTPDQPPARPLRQAQRPEARTAAPRPARAAGGDYAGRDYGHFLDMISSVVEQTLQEHGGDTEAAITALELKAIPNGMALFEATRVGGNYEHTVYPERLEFLSKKTRDGADDIWEGRHKWENGPLLGQVKAGTLASVAVDVLDTNAAYCSALKTWLPIGALQHDPDGGFHSKRSGIYLLPKRPNWEHPHLPDPIGNRREPGPVLLDDATIRLLIRCHKLGLAEAPDITQSWTSGASENITEKFRRVLTLARENAIRDGDDVTEKYVKAIYAKFVSTIGESSFNRDLRRPDWMHIIRSQAFANLWYKAKRAHDHGLTIVKLRGTDELHITGDVPWRSVFEEGRLTTQLKLKNQYTIDAKAA
ncbi:DnaB-like helicase C-terminal domain-containing protein [Streptomyces sp. NPDC087228]|uniref:DnaB-like helicase C-terminal domain-containing protein n=1 Tax=Streptomyces sp. NPDC087228 TaxID=3365772 RepID=UPI00382E022F